MFFYAALKFYIEPEDEPAGDTIKKPEAEYSVSGFSTTSCQTIELL